MRTPRRSATGVRLTRGLGLALLDRRERIVRRPGAGLAALGDRAGVGIHAMLGEPPPGDPLLRAVEQGERALDRGAGVARAVPANAGDRLAEDHVGPGLYDRGSQLGAVDRGLAHRPVRPGLAGAAADV